MNSPKILTLLNNKDVMKNIFDNSSIKDLLKLYKQDNPSLSEAIKYYIKDHSFEIFEGSITEFFTQYNNIPESDKRLKIQDQLNLNNWLFFVPVKKLKIADGYYVLFLIRDDLMDYKELLIDPHYFTRKNVENNSVNYSVHYQTFNKYMNGNREYPDIKLKLTKNYFIFNFDQQIGLTNTYFLIKNIEKSRLLKLFKILETSLDFLCYKIKKS